LAGHGRGEDPPFVGLFPMIIFIFHLLRISAMSHDFRLGLETLIDKPPSWFTSARLGLVVNQASWTSGFEAAWTMIARSGGNISCIFSPQHGFLGEKQANMIESDHGWHEGLNVPVMSLYGRERQPTEEMLRLVDVLVVDLQDVGTRVYTYGATMGLCLEAAAKQGVKFVVLDRPNPIDGETVEGNTVHGECRSFVGLYPLPMRHGMTMGEMAAFIADSKAMDCDLEVFPMKGWKRSDFYFQTPLPWFFPSPNMPSWETALVYAGMVLLEGTNVSEGRGTTLPFHLFGAPFIQQEKLLRQLEKHSLQGVAFRPVSFEPAFDKWRGELCHGFQVHVTEMRKFSPYRTGLALLGSLLQTHGNDFRWLPPPYEYEWEKQPIDILIGNADIRRMLEEGLQPEELEALWSDELNRFMDARERCLLYGP